MRIDIISGVPNLMVSALSDSILENAQKKGLVEIYLHNLRDYTNDKHKTIDDTPYGGGAGMVLKIEPIYRCLEKLKSERSYDEIIYLSPKGERYTQKLATELSLKKNIVLLCGHYKGVDNRVVETLITREISIGDYVLTGGEIPALVIVDSVARLIPGVVGDAESLLSDSFQENLLGAPQYTKPAEFMGLRVPDVLLSGDHKKINEWREEEARKLTEKRRKDLLEKN
ncbi:MAG TPA: tRNA (guanosine(37)-N1)-methyltransferase TrmD [Bacteroidota bacterium]|jgi:tRNA (guanine37-N1)-methyltransferase|nr:tRNA (guanosine(37)-N1)-methyltransferase TrmD [Bacteroidota bacterium]